jgi:hypothetical protein
MSWKETRKQVGQWLGKKWMRCGGEVPVVSGENLPMEFNNPAWRRQQRRGRCYKTSNYKTPNYKTSKIQKVELQNADYKTSKVTKGRIKKHRITKRRKLQKVE